MSDLETRVLIVEDAEELPVAMVQSLDGPDCTMLVADPKIVEPSYTVRLTAEDRAALALGKDGQPVLYCTLSVSADGWISANPLAPLAINPEAAPAASCSWTKARTPPHIRSPRSARTKPCWF